MSWYVMVIFSSFDCSTLKLIHLLHTISSKSSIMSKRINSAMHFNLHNKNCHSSIFQMNQPTLPTLPAVSGPKPPTQKTQHFCTERCISRCLFLFFLFRGLVGGGDRSKESTIYMVWTGLTSDLLREFLMFFVFL